MDQSQRRDIDSALDRITLTLDEENITISPYTFNPVRFVGNNWFLQNEKIVKLNLAEQDSIVFVSEALTNLSEKNITNVIVEFDYEITNVKMNYPILSNISLTCMEMTNYMLVENIITTQGHIEVDCSLFNFSNHVVNTAISNQGFKVGINFSGNKSNATIKLSNVAIKFKFTNKLQGEMDAVSNRISGNFDVYVEAEDLVIDFLGADGTGGGGSSSGGVDIDIKPEELSHANRYLDEMYTLDNNTSPHLTNSGLQTLDGHQAVAWTRIRYLDSDFVRASRQRTVATALMKKVNEMSYAAKLQLLNDSAGVFETNMRSTDIMRVAFNCFDCIDHLEEHRIPDDGLYTIQNDPWMMKIDFAAQKQSLNEYIWGE